MMANAQTLAAPNVLQLTTEQAGSQAVGYLGTFSTYFEAVAVFTAVFVLILLAIKLWKPGPLRIQTRTIQTRKASSPFRSFYLYPWPAWRTAGGHGLGWVGAFGVAFDPKSAATPRIAQAKKRLTKATQIHAELKAEFQQLVKAGQINRAEALTNSLVDKWGEVSKARIELRCALAEPEEVQTAAQQADRANRAQSLNREFMNALAEKSALIIKETEHRDIKAYAEALQTSAEQSRRAKQLQRLDSQFMKAIAERDRRAEQVRRLAFNRSHQPWLATLNFRIAGEN